MKKFILGIALLLPTIFASAHAIWIETALKGTKDKEQEVRVYLGEYAENERDSVAAWFSNLKDLQLYVTGPDGKRQQINLKADGDHYEGNFIPSADGNYTLSIHHTVADVYGETKIEYYASATVMVGKTGPSTLTSSTALAIVPGSEEPKSLQSIPVSVFYEGQPAAAARVEISSPDGWVKGIQGNERGEAAFKPIGKGQYMLEAIKTEKTTGSHNGKPYKTVRHLVTHCIYVKS